MIPWWAGVCLFIAGGLMGFLVFAILTAGGD